MINKTSFLRSPWQRAFLVTLFFVTMAALLFWLDTFRLYQSEVRVFVMSKSPTVTTDEIVANLSELSKNLSFSERVFARNDLLDDDFSDYSKDERKALWNETVTVTQSDKSSVLTVTARKTTLEQARLLSEETVKEIFSIAGFYYNVKTDIDLRIVDEPIVKPVLAHPVRYVLTSFGSALGVTALFFGLLSVIPLLFAKRKRVLVSEHPVQAAPPVKHEKMEPTYSLGEAVPFIDPRKFIPTRPTTLSFGMSHEEEVIRQEIISSAPKAPAPANLPVASSSEVLFPGMETKVTELPFQFEEVPVKEGVADIPPVTAQLNDVPAPYVPTSLEVTPQVEIKQGEPSVEEYKRRLNALLAGGK